MKSHRAVAVLVLVGLLGALISCVAAKGWEEIRYSGVAPAPRSYHTTVQDDSGRAFLFGGNEGVFSFDLQNDLHVFYLASNKWALLQPYGAPPLKRFRHSAVYDPSTKLMVVFGGASAPNDYDAPILLNDLSHYHVDKNQWQTNVRTTGTPPEPRVYHVAVAKDGVMTVFGGNGASSFFNDIHKYHIAEARWEKPAVTGDKPIARSHAATVLYQNKMIIFGGLKWHGPEGYLNDVYAFDLGTNHWTFIDATGSPPTGRTGTSAVVLQNYMYIFAGYEIEGLFVNDLYRLDLDAADWTDVIEEDPIPNKRFSHTALAPQGADDNFLIFYGYADELVLPPQNFDDVWRWRAV